MSVIEELQITPYINAHDTYTVYGGSRMSARTLEDMRQIAAVFVDMDELQLRLGQAAAQLTKNEDAFSPTVPRGRSPLPPRCVSAGATPSCSPGCPP